MVPDSNLFDLKLASSDKLTVNDEQKSSDGTVKEMSYDDLDERRAQQDWKS